MSVISYIIDFDFDHKKYVSLLAECSIGLLQDSFKDSKIIKKTHIILRRIPFDGMEPAFK